MPVARTVRDADGDGGGDSSDKRKQRLLVHSAVARVDLITSTCICHRLKAGRQAGHEKPHIRQKGWQGWIVIGVCQHGHIKARCPSLRESIKGVCLTCFL